MTLKGFGTFGPKLNVAFQISHPKIGQFLWSVLIVSKFQILLVCFVRKVSCLKQRFSQEFYFVTLKCRGMFGPKLKAAFRISPPKIGQFVLSCWKGYKFQILLLSFVWQVSWLNEKTFTGVSFCDTEGPCKHWAKTECCFPNQPPINCLNLFRADK